MAVAEPAPRFHVPATIHATIHTLPLPRCFQELNRRFAAAGSSATAFAVDPGAVRSDIYRTIPKLVMPAFDFFMRCFFLTTDQGCCPSVCTSVWPLEKLAGESDGEQGRQGSGSGMSLAWNLWRAKLQQKPTFLQATSERKDGTQ